MQFNKNITIAIVLFLTFVSFMTFGRGNNYCIVTGVMSMFSTVYFLKKAEFIQERRIGGNSEEHF